MKANKLAVLVIAYAVAFGALSFAFSQPSYVNTPQQGFKSFSSTATSYGNVVILQNGTLSDPSAPIAISGDVYTLTSDMAGSITIERNNITLDGAGYMIDNQSASGGFGVMLNNVNLVTVTDIVVVNLSNQYSSQSRGIYLISSNNNTITGNSVSGGVYGIKLDSSNNNDLYGNTATYNLYGAYICEDSLQNHVYDNDFSYSINDGIFLCTSFNSTINGNDLSHSNARGMYVGNSSHDLIYGNDASFTTWGIYLDYKSNSNSIYSNNFSSTWTGIYMYNGFNNTFTGNDISSTTGYGINVNNSRNSYISGNDLSGGNTGIALNYSSGFMVHENTLTGEYSAVSLLESQGTEVFSNDLSGSSNGISLMSSSGNALYNNTATPVSGYAFYLDSSGNNTVSYNTISSAEYGVYLVSSRNNTIFADTIESGTFAVYLSGSQQNQIFDNTVSGNSNYAITLSGSSSNYFYGNSVSAASYSFEISTSSLNMFYHNSFMINGSQYSIGTGSTNYWDYGYPDGGNYWSNYTGSDQFSGPDQNIPGSDDIGDTPYNLTPDNVDHYPLMGPWVNHFAIFTAVGLASGTEWSVTFNNTTLTSITSQISFMIPSSGSSNYTYSIGFISGYQPYPVSGIVVFTGSDVNTIISFTNLYNVSFMETGLAPGTQWSVSLNGSLQTTTGEYLNFTVDNGQYDYVISAVGGYYLQDYAGQVSVNGTPVVVPVAWNTYNYTITFMETGLPAGTQWQVTYNGELASSSTDSIQYTSPNGTYSYSVKPIAGFTLSSYTGSVNVDGSNVQVTVAWQHYNYSVIFSASGLPAGQSWSVTLNSVQQASASSNIGFNMPNGTYSYTIGTISGYHASRYSGTVTVSGNDAQASISWIQVKYQVTFTQNGLPSGTEWWVNLTGGNSYHSTGSTITFDLSNGTHAYTASAGGYTSSPSSGNITVSGASPSGTAVNFTKESSQGGFPVWYWYVIGGVIVIAGVSVIVVYLLRRPKSP